MIFDNCLSKHEPSSKIKFDIGLLSILHVLNNNIERKSIKLISVNYTKYSFKISESFQITQNAIFVRRISIYIWRSFLFLSLFFLFSLFFVLKFYSFLHPVTHSQGVSFALHKVAT